MRQYVGWEKSDILAILGSFFSFQIAWLQSTGNLFLIEFWPCLLMLNVCEIVLVPLEFDQFEVMHIMVMLFYFISAVGSIWQKTMS